MSPTLPLVHDLADLVANEIPLPLPVAAPPRDPDIASRMESVKKAILAKAGGEKALELGVGQIIRDAVDYVIDAPTLYRYSTAELEADEKTAVGKRIERMLRFQFDIPRGKKLDIQLAGEDVDIKTTMGRNWMFSRSSFDHINLLIAYNENSARFNLGLVYVLPEHLGSKNRDEKQSLRSKFKEQIVWLVKDASYPVNFLAMLPPETLRHITERRYGMQRILSLFRSVTNVSIPRHALCSVANQDDPLKRARTNGGARDRLWRERFMILSGKSESDSKIAARALGVVLKKDEFLSLDLNSTPVDKSLVDEYCMTHKLQ